jgi:hypothetical protein
MRLDGTPKPQYLLREWAPDVESLARALESEGRASDQATLTGRRPHR